MKIKDIYVTIKEIFGFEIKGVWRWAVVWGSDLIYIKDMTKESTRLKKG